MSTIITFGKYRGLTFEEVKKKDDKDYYKYLLKRKNTLRDTNRIVAEDLIKYLDYKEKILNLSHYFKYPVVVSEYSEDFRCPICTEISMNLKITKCRHTFCTECIQKSLENSNNCPICRQTISNEDIYELPLMLNNIINDLKCKCPYEGCKEILTYNELKLHTFGCRFSNPMNVLIYAFFESNVRKISADTFYFVSSVYNVFKTYLTKQKAPINISKQEFTDILIDHGFKVVNNKVFGMFIVNTLNRPINQHKSKPQVVVNSHYSFEVFLANYLRERYDNVIIRMVSQN